MIQMWLSMKTNAGSNCGGPPSLGMILMQSLLSAFLSSSRSACSKPGAAISSTSSMVIPSNAGEHSPTARGSADATPADPIARPATMAEMAIRVLPMSSSTIDGSKPVIRTPTRHDLSTPTRRMPMNPLIERVCRSGAGILGGELT
jgi:hypothetical protein